MTKYDYTIHGTFDAVDSNGEEMEITEDELELDDVEAVLSDLLTGNDISVTSGAKADDVYLDVSVGKININQSVKE